MTFSEIISIIWVAVIGLGAAIFVLLYLLYLLFSVSSLRLREKKPFISKEEKENLDRFFERKLESVVDGKIEVSQLCRTPPKNNSFDHVVDSEIARFHRDEKTNGILINCHKSDGISWLAEKILELSEKVISESGYKKDDDMRVGTVRRDKRIEIPIAKFIGGERGLLKMAIAEGLVERIRPSFTSNLVALCVTVVGALAFALDLSSMLEKMDITVGIAELNMLIGLVLFLAVAFNIVNIWVKYRKARKKEMNGFLDKIGGSNIGEDKKYRSLVNKIVVKMNDISCKMVMIIDDISSLDEYGFSQEVIFRFFEKSDRKYRHFFWIILSSNISSSYRLVSRTRNPFVEFTLRLLNRDEKEKLCAELDLDRKCSSFDTIKEICSGQDEGVRQSFSDELSALKNESPDLFMFLYLLALNDYPVGSDYKVAQLMEKIPPRANVREKDVLIKKIFGHIPTTVEIEDFFNDNRMKRYYSLDPVSKKFHINNTVSRLVESDPNFLDCRKEYGYGEGYWGLTWYFAHKEKPNVHYVQKISHHLEGANSNVEEAAVRQTFLNAYLFAAKNSLSYLRRNNVEHVLAQLLGLNLQGVDNFDSDTTVKLILEAFLNFDRSLGSRARFEDLGYRELHSFLDTRNIDVAFQLLQNPAYSPFSGHLVSFLLEQYWERETFFLTHTKTRSSYLFANEIPEESATFNLHFANYFQAGKENVSPLYLHNLASYIWIGYIRLLRGDDSFCMESMIGNIESFAACFRAVKTAGISSNDVYYQAVIQESICLVASVILLLQKKQDVDDGQRSVFDDMLSQFNSVLNEIKLDTSDYGKTLERMEHFLLLHSLMWKHCDFGIRVSMLSAARLQLFLFRYDKCNNDEELIAKAKEISQITESMDNRNRLSSVLRFSLSLNDYLIDDKAAFSFNFQQGVKLPDTNKVTGIQFEYLYFCTAKCWYISTDKLHDILTCLVSHSGNYSDLIVERLVEDPAIVLWFCNTLNSYPQGREYDEAVRFFGGLIERAKSYPEADMESAECIWENHKFRHLSILDKQVHRRKFEEFWSTRKSHIHFGSALSMLVEMSEGAVPPETMADIYDFLMCKDMEEDEDGNSFRVERLLLVNFNLTLACRFCEEKKTNDELDEAYNEILELIIMYESKWEEWYGDMFDSSIMLYSTLYEHADEGCQSYNEKYKHYKLLKMESSIRNFEINDSSRFFSNLCNVFEYDLERRFDFSPGERELLEKKDMDTLLKSVDLNSIQIILDREISGKYLWLCNAREVGPEDRKKLNAMADQALPRLIALIMDIPGNKKYLDRIRSLFEELNNPSVSYDDE